MKQKTYKIPNAPEGHPELPVYKTPDGREVVLTPARHETLVSVEFIGCDFGSLYVSPTALTPVYLSWPDDGDLVVLLYDDSYDGFGTISAGGKQTYRTRTHEPHTPESCRIFLPPKGHVLTGENLRREWLEANAKEWEVI